MKILILLGAPGAGKGTVAQYLVENYDVRHFSTGNLLRNEVKRETDIGLKVKDILGSGGLVGDDIVNGIDSKNIEEVLDKGSLVILDGYPRTRNQAVELDKMMSGSLKDEIRVIKNAFDEVFKTHDVVLIPIIIENTINGNTFDLLNRLAKSLVVNILTILSNILIFKR